MPLDVSGGVRLDLVLRAPDTKQSAEHRLSPHSGRHRRAALDFIAAQMEPVAASRSEERDITIG